jgi:predicted DNA-binding protein YlxM (UPF0122 family)
MAKETDYSRISDAEWMKREIDYLKKFVDYETAMKLAKRNVKKRDLIDKLRAQ